MSMTTSRPAVMNCPAMLTSQPPPTTASIRVSKGRSRTSASSPSLTAISRPMSMSTPNGSPSASISANRTRGKEEQMVSRPGWIRSAPTSAASTDGGGLTAGAAPASAMPTSIGAPPDVAVDAPPAAASAPAAVSHAAAATRRLGRVVLIASPLSWPSSVPSISSPRHRAPVVLGRWQLDVTVSLTLAGGRSVDQARPEGCCRRRRTIAAS